MDFMRPGKFVSVERHANARPGGHGHVAVVDGQVGTLDDILAVHKMNVVRVARERELRRDRPGMDHRGHRDAGVVVAVLTQPPIQRFRDGTQRLKCGKPPPAVVITQDDIDGLGTHGTGDVLKTSNA